MTIVQALLANGLAVAGGEARRKVNEGAVYVNGTRVQHTDYELPEGEVTIHLGNPARAKVTITVPRKEYDLRVCDCGLPRFSGTCVECGVSAI